MHGRGRGRGGIQGLGLLLAAAAVLPACRRQGAARPSPEVGIVVVQPGRAVLTSELPGRVSAFLVAEVHPQVSGLVQARAFTEGSLVRAGDVLYRLDPAPFRAALGTALAAQARAEANLDAARKRAMRTRVLLKAGTVGQQADDDATAAFQQAEAEAQAAKAGVEAARINLGYTEIQAPITGRIGRSSVTPGALATAYQGPAFATIQQLDPVYVDAPQSSAALLELRRHLGGGRAKGLPRGQARVRLVLEDGTPYGPSGVLRFSEVTVDPSTGSQNLRMVFPNPAQVLLPGMYVRVLVEEGVLEGAILVPQQGVTHDPKGQAVAMVVDASGKAEQRPLQVDRAIGDQWLVREGLRPGDRLILEGLQKIRPGMAVKAVPFGARSDSAK